LEPIDFGGNAGKRDSLDWPIVPQRSESVTKFARASPPPGYPASLARSDSGRSYTAGPMSEVFVFHSLWDVFCGTERGTTDRKFLEVSLIVKRTRDTVRDPSICHLLLLVRSPPLFSPRIPSLRLPLKADTHKNKPTLVIRTS
jgi:hypothetical protein